MAGDFNNYTITNARGEYADIDFAMKANPNIEFDDAISNNCCDDKTFTVTVMNTSL